MDHTEIVQHDFVWLRFVKKKCNILISVHFNPVSYSADANWSN